MTQQNNQPEIKKDLPPVRHWAVFFSMWIGSLIISLFIALFLRPERDPEWVALVRHEPVKATDMLSLVVTMSGIAIPLLIAFLLTREKDLQVTIAERAWFYLDQNGVMASKFRSIVLHMTENSLDATPDLSALLEFTQLGTPDTREDLTHDALRVLIPSDSLRQVYNDLFANLYDRTLVRRSIIFVGIPALIAFVSMYLRYFKIDASWFEIFECFIIVFTGFANVIAYVLVAYIVTKKVAIRNQAHEQVKRCCRQVKQELIGHFNDMSKSSKAMGRELDEIKERAERQQPKQSWPIVNRPGPRRPDQ